MKILSFSCRDFRNLHNIEINSFDEMNVKAVTVNDSDGQQVQVEFSSDMAYTFNTYDFWDGKLKMERRTDYYQGTITYVYKDGKWLQDTSNLGFYVY